MSTPAQEPLIADLLRDEGLRLKPYMDTMGKLTIGIGRNLTDVGVSEQEAKLLLVNDITRSDDAMRKDAPWVFDLDAVRRDVLRNMCFNLGWRKLQGFRRTLAAVQAHDYAQAAQFMLESDWAKQVGARSERLAAMMRTGKR